MNAIFLETDENSTGRISLTLLTTTKSQNEVKGRLLLDIVVWQGPAVFQLLSSKDQPLLIWGDTLLVLDFGLDVFNGVGGLHFEGDGLAGERLDEDLHLELLVEF